MLNNAAVESLIISDAEEAAESAGLRYVCDNENGFFRQKNGKGFIYLDKSGSKVTDEKLLSRFTALVIPPAWTNVWICSRQNGHLQATGRDVKGRKQYIYHPKWDEIRNETKFSKMVLFGEALPGIREKVEEDFNRRLLLKEKLLATIIKLLEETLIRIGNNEYAVQNDSYGLTTLKNEHLEVDGTKLKFVFKGKSGKMWEVDIKDKRIARVIKMCQDLPGQELFQYFDEDKTLQTIDSNDVNCYLKEISGQDFTAKDFRTWGGTVRMLSELLKIGSAANPKELKRNITAAIKSVAKALSNTPTICRKYYVHPAIVNSYTSGSIFSFYDETKKIGSMYKLSVEELAVLGILRSALP